jgi:SAM-dependent methyltransferase
MFANALRTLPYKFRELHRRFGQRPFALLDIGAGNHSATIVHRWFPNCRYSGVDRERGYENDARDFELMSEFFELDLTALDFSVIPDGRYDAIMLAHVIEHLHNGDDVLRALVPKLKPGGIVYAEFPGPQSLHLPSKKGSLNFHDDPTHVRVFTAGEVAGVLRAEGLTILHARRRRDPLMILLTPARAIKAKLEHGYVPGGVLWDLFGFADEVLAEKPAVAPSNHTMRGA